MDKLLVDDFQRLGGGLQAGVRWQNDFSDGIVRANGRRVQSRKMAGAGLA